jgi:hypothetical protein
VGQLSAAMPNTITAADQLLRSGCPPEARHRALDLLLALAAVECHAGTGGTALVLPGLLRDLVIVTTRLVGRTWLDANAEETAPFTRVQSSLHAPPLPELDLLLACLLADRFGLSATSRQPGPELTQHRPAPAGANRRGRPAGPDRPGQPVELPQARLRTDRDARSFAAAASLDGPGRDESRRGTADQPGTDSCDTADRVTSPATAAAVPTWICLLRRVNLGLRRELRFDARRRSAS